MLDHSRGELLETQIPAILSSIHDVMIKPRGAKAHVLYIVR